MPHVCESFQAENLFIISSPKDNLVQFGNLLKESDHKNNDLSRSLPVTGIRLKFERHRSGHGLDSLIQLLTLPNSA